MFKQYKGLRKELYVLFFGRVMTNLGSMIWPMLTLILNKTGKNVKLLKMLQKELDQVITDFQ